LAAVLKGVHTHAGLLRAGIASAGNDHRLGANEAPPAIISVFLGNLLDRILNEIESGNFGGQGAEAAVIRLGVSKIPEVMKDNTDRNRTSPFAFTGNKFEFRAVGSSASVAFPVTLVNAAAADGFEQVTKLLQSKLDSGKRLDEACLETVREVVKATKAIRFEGNNYSDEWVVEAEKRGLLNLRKTPEALEQLVSKSATEMLPRLGIFTAEELQSRYHVRLERYIKNLLIEVDTLRSMVDTQIQPACFEYHGVLLTQVAQAKALDMWAPQLRLAERMGGLLEALQQRRDALEAAMKKFDDTSGESEKAVLLAGPVSEAMLEVRGVCDELESIMDDSRWPLPKYREMLFLA
jgi:glutamine synthetase